MLFALFSWGGRMGRLAYFGYSLLLVAVLAVLGLIFLLPLLTAADGRGVAIAIVIVLVLLGICGGFCLAAKRLHDLNLPAWHYVWMIFVPALFSGFGAAMQQLEMKLPSLLISLLGSLISLLIGLYLLFWPGTDGPNDFGER